MSGRLRATAARLLRQLDAGTAYREHIERDIERRLGKAPVTGGSKVQDPPYAVCVQCSTKNDADARFCKGCGKSMESRA